MEVTPEADWPDVNTAKCLDEIKILRSTKKPDLEKMLLRKYKSSRTNPGPQWSPRTYANHGSFRNLPDLVDPSITASHCGNPNLQEPSLGASISRHFYPAMARQRFSVQHSLIPSIATRKYTEHLATTFVSGTDSDPPAKTPAKAAPYLPTRPRCASSPAPFSEYSDGEAKAARLTDR